MIPTMPKVTPTAALFAKKPLEEAPAVEEAKMVDVGLLWAEKEPVVTGTFEARCVVGPPITALDMVEVAEVVGLRYR